MKPFQTIFFFTGTVALLKTPFQNSSSVPLAVFARRAPDIRLQETGATSVKTFAKIVVRRQFSLRVQTDFVEHSSEEDDAADFSYELRRPEFHRL